LCEIKNIYPERERGGIYTQQTIPSNRAFVDGENIAAPHVAAKAGLYIELNVI
jgi:hypothetical protein